MNQHETDSLAEFFYRYEAEHAAEAARGERLLIPAGVLKRLSAAHGASDLESLLGGWEQDGDVVILGDWNSLPDDAPSVEVLYGNRKTEAKRPASERLVKFLKEDCAVCRQEIDPDHFLSRIEAVGARVAIAEFLQYAEANNIDLPPGYWSILWQLKLELAMDETRA
jgi:hypothetical protein